MPRGRDRPHLNTVYYMFLPLQGGYYLTTRGSFRVSGAPSNNKGWKAHHFFVSLRAPEVRSLEGGDARPKKRPKLGVQKVSKSTAARRPLCERPATPRRVSE
ncbi:hypothetical protein BHM03_00027524 [Ensete ventricosum]|nr:hypothetical protein BHM03_00027524 [Ensete ventricosum]